MKVGQTMLALAFVLAGAAGLAPAQTVRLADGTPIHVRLKADLLSNDAVVRSSDFTVAPTTQKPTPPPVL